MFSEIETSFLVKNQFYASKNKQESRAGFFFVLKKTSVVEFGQVQKNRFLKSEINKL